MATLLSVVAHDRVEALRDRIIHIHDEGHRKRLRAIIRLKQGALRGDVAVALGASRTSVRRWITKYNDGGWKTLAPNKGGRPEGNPKWGKEVFDDFAKRNRQRRVLVHPAHAGVAENRTLSLWFYTPWLLTPGC